MSAEVENNKEEEAAAAEQQQQQKQKKSIRQHAKDQWQIIIKILELLICAACMGFVYDPAKVTGLGKSHMHHVGIMYTAYTGYMLINTVFLIGKAIGDKIPYRTSALFSVSGSAVFLVTAILLVVDRTYLMKHYFYHPEMYMLTMLTTSITFAFVNVLIFAVDAVFTFRRQEDF